MALKVLKLFLISAATWFVVRPFVRGQVGSRRDDDLPIVGAHERAA
jgi:hypothetical protein